jgi:hypothetical protein
MSARIMILNGPSKGLEFAIQTRVSRIGGHPGSEICVPEQAESVATLRFKDNAYTLFNRSDQELDLAGALLAKDAASIWKAGKVLTLPGGVRLKMVVEGAPDPVKIIPSTDNGQDDFDEDEVEVAPPKPARTSELFVIILLIPLGVWMYIQSEKPGQSAQGTSIEYADLIIALSRTEVRASAEQGESGASSDSIGTENQLPNWLADTVAGTSEEEYVRYDTLREGLQNARLAELRYDYSLATSEYQNLRDILLELGAETPGPHESAVNQARLFGQDAAEPGTIYEAVSRYVRRRLTVLTP